MSILSITGTTGRRSEVGYQRNVFQRVVRSCSLGMGIVLGLAMMLPAGAGAQGPGGCPPMSMGTQFADVTGGGRADAIVINKHGVGVRRSDGARFLRFDDWSRGPFFGSDESGNANIYFADVTGDGRADAIVSNPSGIDVRVSDGRQFLRNEDWTHGPFFGSAGGRHNLYLADVDGDHRADAIVVNPNGIFVRRSDGRRFLRTETWTNEPYFGEFGTYFADVTGDGKADAIVVNRNGIVVRPSDGERFLPNEVWMEGLFVMGRDRRDYHDRDRDRDRDRGHDADRDRRERERERERERDWNRPRGNVIAYYFADVDGDGRADAILVTTEGVLVGLSDGTRFLPANWWVRGPFFGAIGTYFVDVTGDGKADAIAVTANGIFIRRSDGTQFLPNEVWTRDAYYGNIAPLCGVR